MVRSQSNNTRTQTLYDLKYKNKNNKTVIRAERVSGKFTTIPHRIIHDKRLSTDARLLLISILSDAESFDFSRTGLINRLGLTEYKLDNALNELNKFGYIKKTKTHGQYFHYTISEYGNLQNIDENLSKDDSVTNETTQAQNVKSDYMYSEQYNEDWNRLIEYLTEREDYVNYELLKEAIPNIQSREDVFELKLIQDKEINKEKIKYYKMAEDFVNEWPVRKELKEKTLKEVRRLITEEHQMPSTKKIMDIRINIGRNQYKNKIKKYGYDYETEDVDNYENPMD